MGAVGCVIGIGGAIWVYERGDYGGGGGGGVCLCAG